MIKMTHQIRNKPQCRHKCKDIKFIKTQYPGKGYYANGAVLCNECGWLKLDRWQQRCCPCCGLQLRISPKRNVSRHKVNQEFKRY